MNKLNLSLFFAVAAALFCTFGSPANAEDTTPICAKCPSGCIPAGYVQDLKSADELKSAPPECPAGCTPLAFVKNLLTSPLCREETLSDVMLKKDKPKLDANEKKKPRQTTEDDNAFSTRHRIMFSPTALNLEPMEQTITGYVGVLWEYQIGLTNHIQLGTLIMVPIGVFGILPTLRFSYNVSPEWNVGFGLMGGGFFPMEFTDTSLYTIGANASLSFYKKPFTFNLGIMVNNFGLRWDDEFHNSKSFIILPNVGFAAQFGKNWSFLLDVIVPAAAQIDRSSGDWDMGEWPSGKIFFIFYGLRGHGDLVYGDVGFFVPAARWFFDYMWKYAPLGVPYFSIGFKI